MRNIMTVLLTQIFLSGFQDGKLSGEILIDKKSTGNNLEGNRLIFPSYLMDAGKYEKTGRVQTYYLSPEGKAVIITIKGPT